MFEIAGYRVLLVAQFSKMGGTRTYFKLMVEFYKSQHVDLFVVTQGPECDPEMTDFLEARGIPFQDLSSDFLANDIIGSPFQGKKALKKKLELQSKMFQQLVERHRIDLVVVSISTPGSLLGALHTSSKSIYLIHTYPHGLRARVMSERGLGAFIPESTKLVTVSNYSCEKIIRAWRLREHGHQVQCLYSTAGPLVPTQSDVARNTTVLTLGHVDKHKNPRGWIKTAKEVLETMNNKEVRFVWLGEGSQLDQCRRTVAGIGFSDRIIFAGYTPAVATYYENSAIYFQPSKVENLGLSVLDAQRYGIPSVVSDAGGLPEAVHSGLNGLVYRAGNHIAAATALRQLLFDSRQRVGMGINARSIYSGKFSPQSWTKNLVQIHLDALQVVPEL